MKILLCHNFYQSPGGEDRTFEAEQRLLERHGHDVVLYTRHNDEIDAMSSADVAWRAIWNPRTYREVSALAQRERPQLVHCINTFPLISAAVYSAARRNGAAVVQGLHNFRLACVQGGFLRRDEMCELCTATSLPWPAVKHACYHGSRAGSAAVAAMLVAHRAARTWTRAVDAFRAPSAMVKHKLAAAGLPAERIHVVHNYLTDDPGVGAGGGGYAMFAGRLAADKGIDTLLRAWSEMSEPMALKIAGDGPLAGEVRRAAAADRRIEWLGWRSGDELQELIGNAECLLVPSVFHEAFGRVVIEAYAKGTPVIASRRGALPELIEDGATGYLFEPGDSSGLLAKLRLLMADAARRAEMRRRSRQRFEEQFTGERGYEGLMELYGKALQHRAGR